MNGDLLTVALRHATAGRPVFPCRPNKKPATVNGFYDASTDPKVIERWFVVPGRLLAIPTGQPSRLVILDADPRHRGDESLRDLERKHEPLPRTASVKTPSGGAHYYFRWPGVKVPCSAGTIAPGIDIRGDGGYACVPPSRLPDGRAYEPDEETPPAELPGWLLFLVTERLNGNGQRASPAEYVALVRDGATEGQRNDSLARLLGHLLRKNVDVDLAAEIAHLVNTHRFQPPLEGGEVDRVVNSIAAAELRRRRKS